MAGFDLMTCYSHRLNHIIIIILLRDLREWPIIGSSSVIGCIIHVIK